MATYQERHIAKIRRDRLDTQESSIATYLASTLDISNTRFILELIQNADENTYFNENPTLEIHLGDSWLRLDSNEVGFSAEDVDSICGVGKSTRKGQIDFVGYQGIGFKSVFRVAHEVLISSNGYSFKFDDREKLGILTPDWVTFPKEHSRIEEGLTQILLWFKPMHGKVWSNIKKELDELEPSTLAFLHRLKRIEITQRSSETYAKRILSRQDSIRCGGAAVEVAEELVDGDGSISLLIKDSLLILRRVTEIDQSLKWTHKYSIPRKIVTGIVLAFPVDQEDLPIVKDQKAYAFLPIKHSGMQFLIQADFEVVAGGEGILSNDWNRKLLVEVNKAFQDAIIRFNQCPTLKYTWINYLPADTVSAPPLFTQLIENVTESSKGTEVLESMSGVMAQPKDLFWVPKSFRDEHLKPLLNSKELQDTYLSDYYDWDTFQGKLTQLGVKPLEKKQFEGDLIQFCQNNQDDFINKDSQWHEHLARALLRDDDNLSASLRGMVKLIPVNSGKKWITSMDKNVVFDSEDHNWSIPGNIGLSPIHSDAFQGESQTNRRKLFHRLGARSLTHQQIADHILHQHEVGKVLDSSLEDLISQARYIFRTDKSARSLFGLHSPLADQLFLAKSDRSLGRGSDIYIDLPGSSFPISKIYAECLGVINLLHPGYIDAVHESERARWLEWLQSALKIQCYPRLSRNGNLTLEFQHLTAKNPLNFLKVFVENFNNYLWMLDEPLKEALGNTRVKCLSGEYRPLRDTFLPSSEMMKDQQEAKMLAHIELPNPDETIWRKLSCLGVGIDKTLRYYLELLKAAKDQNICHEKIPQFYAEIEERFSDNSDWARFVLRDKIFIPATKSEGALWAEVEDCLWKAPSYIRYKYILAPIYGERSRLFTEFLKLKDANVENVIRELSLVKEIDCATHPKELARLKEMLRALSNNYKLNDVHKSSLLAQPIFPVRSRSHGGIELFSASRVFFVSDRPSLGKAFEGAIPILDWEVKDLGSIKQLLEYLSLENRFLSIAATENSVIDGWPSPNEEFTAYLKTKTKFISELVSLESREIVQQRMTSLQVLQINSVISRREINYNGKTIFVPNGVANQICSTQNGELKIYLSKEDLIETRNVAYWELAGSIAKHCNIDSADTKTIRLIERILSCGDESKITLMLEKENIFLMEDAAAEKISAAREPGTRGRMQLKPSQSGESTTSIAKANSQGNTEGGDDRTSIPDVQDEHMFTDMQSMRLNNNDDYSAKAGPPSPLMERLKPDKHEQIQSALSSENSPSENQEPTNITTQERLTAFSNHRWGPSLSPPLRWPHTRNAQSGSRSHSRNSNRSRSRSPAGFAEQSTNSVTAVTNLFGQASIDVKPQPKTENLDPGASNS